MIQISIRKIIDELKLCSDGSLNETIETLASTKYKTHKSYLTHLLALNERNERHWQYKHQLSKGKSK